MMRYEITTKPGVILDATFITQVAAPPAPKTQSTLVVFIDSSDQVAFEKDIEGHSGVLGYVCDPRVPGTIITKWKRP